MRFFIGICLLTVLAAGAFVLAAWRPAIEPITPPSADTFSRALIERGATLAAIGNCNVCHTAPGGRIFAGGLGIATPFGTVYSTNITPDAETGIGRWSEAAFRRAMREGVRRDGRYLYPAFPYDHFTLVSDADDEALYAFLMTREPVRARAPENHLVFPLNLRLVMFGWNLWYLHRGPYRADPAHDEIWNRGAYLAQGLGHCGACHTPRNRLGAETDRAFAGGSAEGWTAYALDASSPARVSWSEAALESYLHRGFDPTHGVAHGPMASVTQDLRTVPLDQVRAIAIFIAAQMPSASASPDAAKAQIAMQSGRGVAPAPQSGDSQANVRSWGGASSRQKGALIYAGVCAGCHEGPRAMPYGGIDLHLSSSIGAPSARNLFNTVLRGLPAADGVNGPIMPGFAASLNDSQVVALAAYLRGRFADKPPWQGLEGSLRQAQNTQRAAIPLRNPAGVAALHTADRTTEHETHR